MKPKVLVTRKIYERPLQLLQEKAEVTMHLEPRAMTPEEIIAAFPGKWECWPWGATGFPPHPGGGERPQDRSEQCRGVQQYRCGGGHTSQNCGDEHAGCADGYHSRSQFRFDPGSGPEVDGSRPVCPCRKVDGMEAGPDDRKGCPRKTLGIIGLGRIGSAVAKRGQGFNMRIVYTDIRRLHPAVEQQHQLQFMCLRDLLQIADFVTLHVPLTPETFHLVGAAHCS